MIHDIYTPYLIDTFNKIGNKTIDNPDKVEIVWDHCMPTAVAKNDYDHYNKGLELAARLWHKAYAYWRRYLPQYYA